MKSFAVLKQVNSLVQKTPTAPEDVNCGEGYHKHAAYGANYCHVIDRDHAAGPGRPPGAVAVADRDEGAEPPRRLVPAAAAAGFRPPINGHVAAGFAVDDFGQPVHYTPSNVNAVRIDVPEEFRDFVEKTLEKLPQRRLQGLSIKTDETKDSKLTTFEHESKTLVLHKLPHKDKPITPEQIAQNMYHQWGHMIYGEIARSVRLRSDGFYNSAKGNPRAFITNMSKQSPFEWFAEFVSYYVEHPKFTWIRHRAMYGLLKYQVFETQEYRTWSKLVNPRGAADLAGVV